MINKLLDKLVQMLQAGRARLWLMWNADSCPACRRRGLIDNWTSYTFHEEERLVIFGCVPSPAECFFCETKMRPEVRMRDGRPHWIYGWYKWGYGVEITGSPLARYAPEFVAQSYRARKEDG